MREAYRDGGRRLGASAPNWMVREQAAATRPRRLRFSLQVIEGCRRLTHRHLGRRHKSHPRPLIRIGLGSYYQLPQVL